MHRLFCNSDSISVDKILIADIGKIHHLKDVLRLTFNERVVVYDECGNEYDTVIEELTPKNMVLKIKESQKASLLKKVSITVACALPKKSKFDDIVDKLTQLGVERIIPMETERVIIKLKSDKKKMRLERWKKIALSASEQSQRNTLPVIEPVKDITEVLNNAGEFDLKLIPTLADERKNLNEILRRPRCFALLRKATGTPQNDRGVNILVLIGPEGDFSPSEVGMAKNAGFIPITLGELVLRVETAAVAAVSMLNYALSVKEDIVKEDI